MNILREWLAFLEGYYLARLKDSSLSTLTAMVATIRERIAVWPNPPQMTESRLLHSGYAQEETGLDALRKLWDYWYPGQEPDSLFAVSPFFDENPADRSLARDLKTRFPELRETTIVTDAGVGGRLGQSHFGAAPAQADCRLLLIPEQLEETELKRIRLASSLSERKAKDLLIQRKLHAKILVLRSGNSGLAYMGSGNFSRKAWNGDNRELGVAFKEPDAIRLEGRILKSLGVSGENHFSKLPLTAPPLSPEADLEGYRDDSEFPGFIECIRLIPDAEGASVRFEIESGSRPDPDARQLHQYQVEWGPTRLDFSADFRSQWIDMKVFRQRIPGYRNLLFQFRNAPEKKYFFPFQYSGTLIEDRETFILPTSLDWMAFYLNPDADYRYSDFEKIPGEEQTNIRRPDLLDVDRSANTVIAMQAYLNLFAKVEDDFLCRIASVCELEPDQREAMVKRDFVEPLRSYGRILEQEAATWKENGPDSLFKMGEFLGLVRQLRQSTTPDVRPHFDPILEHAERCIGLWKGNQPLRKEYAAFVTGRGP